MKNPNKVTKIKTKHLVEIVENGNRFDSPAMETEVALIEFIKSTNLSKANIEKLAKLIENYGLECYSNGYSCAEDDNNF